jgi:hypothetical protein
MSRHTQRGKSQPLHFQATFMVLDLLHRHGVVEVRIPRTPNGTLSGYFDDRPDLIRAVAPWNGRASIYITLNELVPDVLARARNRLQGFATVTTAAEDVRRRRWFAVDVDAVRLRGIPSTDAEMARALARRDEVIAYLSDHGHFPAPLRTLSGNAGWGLWSVDLANSAEITALYQAALAVLDERFSDQNAKVDPAVAQPAQLTKLPMTIAVTGDEIPGRPHRRVQIQYPVPEHLLDPTQANLVTLDHLRWLAAQGSPRRTYSFPLASKGLDPLTVFRARGLYLRELPDA